jgi:hypothetical protein
MGTWSTALFGNDTASDVRENYLLYLRSGHSNAKATRQILEDYDDELADKDETFMVWSALAATQWDVGRLQTKVLKKALRLIREGGDLARWQAENTPQELGSRKRVIQSLKKKLESNPPPEKRLRRIKQPEKAIQQPERWKKGQIISYQLKNGRLALLFVEGTWFDERFGNCPYFSLLDWQGKRLPSAAQLTRTVQKLPLLLDAACILEKNGAPIPWDRIMTLPVTRKGRGNLRINEAGVGGLQSETTWKELDAWIIETSDPDHQEAMQDLL